MSALLRWFKREYPEILKAKIGLLNAERGLGTAADRVLDCVPLLIDFYSSQEYSKVKNKFNYD